MYSYNKRNSTIKRVIFFAPYIVLAGLVYMPLFGHLDSLPLRLWDESRLAMSAYEMYKNGNLLVVHYDGMADMWSTKPPLLIWVQAFFIKILGANVLAVRLPSALAALATCWVLLFFSRRYLGQFWFGFIAVLVLITSAGYVRMHGVRTADYDALLTLFTTLSGLLFFAFCQTKKNKHLYLFFLFITLAALTKGIAGLLFVPALIIYSLLAKQFLPLLKSKHFYFGLLFFLAMVLGYYFLREKYNPGYLNAVWMNELGGRYLNTLEGHDHNFWFYYNHIINNHFSYWYLLVPCGLLTSLVIKDQKIKKLTLFSVIMVVTYFLIISSGQTKLDWYELPLYPYLAILVTVFVHHLFSLLASANKGMDAVAFNPLPYALLFVLCLAPYQYILSKTYMPKEDNEQEKAFYAPSNFLQGAVKGHYKIAKQYFIMEGYNPHLLFYIKMLKEKGIEVPSKDYQNLSTQDTILVYQDNIMQYVEEHYLHKKTDLGYHISKYQILGVRQ